MSTVVNNTEQSNRGNIRAKRQATEGKISHYQFVEDGGTFDVSKYNFSLWDFVKNENNGLKLTTSGEWKPSNQKINSWLDAIDMALKLKENFFPLNKEIRRKRDMSFENHPGFELDELQRTFSRAELQWSLKKMLSWTDHEFLEQRYESCISKRGLWDIAIKDLDNQANLMASLITHLEDFDAKIEGTKLKITPIYYPIWTCLSIPLELFENRLLVDYLDLEGKKRYCLMEFSTGLCIPYLSTSKKPTKVLPSSSIIPLSSGSFFDLSTDRFYKNPSLSTNPDDKPDFSFETGEMILLSELKDSIRDSKPLESDDVEEQISINEEVRFGATFDKYVSNPIRNFWDKLSSAWRFLFTMIAFLVFLVVFTLIFVAFRRTSNLLKRNIKTKKARELKKWFRRNKNQEDVELSTLGELSSI